MAHRSMSATYEYIPESILRISNIAKKIKNGETVELNRSQIKKLGIDRHLANLMFQDIAFSLVSSQSFGTSILTSSEKHVEILNAITDDKQLNENNKISRALLSAKVPLANDLNIADVLRLRKREQDSFILFRKCLRDAIGEYCKIKGSITDNQARDIYCSIIEPGLARLNKKVEKARRDLIKGARRELLGWAGAISFGVYSGFLNADILTMASAMGLATIATALKKIMKKSDFEEEVKQEDLYFLWKIKKLNNK